MQCAKPANFRENRRDASNIRIAAVTCAKSERACAICFSYSLIEAAISSRLRLSVVTVRISGMGICC
jgi:hypothetical protein